MKIPLSRRLEAACRFIHPGDRVADVGCDHGYLGIHLLKNNIASFVYASDINEGPLGAAVFNAEKFGVRDKMQFYLSDGVKNIPREFDVMVCCGMGGDTMISILEASSWLKDSKYRLILQCQSKRPELRRYLSENGWRIQDEIVLRDGKFLYTVMEVVYGGGVGSALGNFLWAITFGWMFALSYVLAGIFNCVTIIGIPFGMQAFKLAKLAWAPFGAEIL